MLCKDGGLNEQLLPENLVVSYLVKDLPAAYFGIQGFITRADYWILSGAKFIFHTQTS